MRVSIVPVGRVQVVVDERRMGVWVAVRLARRIERAVPVLYILQ